MAWLVVNPIRALPKLLVSLSTVLAVAFAMLIAVSSSNASAASVGTPFVLAPGNGESIEDTGLFIALLAIENGHCLQDVQCVGGEEAFIRLGVYTANADTLQALTPADPLAGVASDLQVRLVAWKQTAADNPDAESYAILLIVEPFQ